MTRLLDICTKIGSGATPTGGKSAYLDEGISLIRSQNVLDLSFTTDGLAYINDEQAKKLNNVEVQKGDILLNITGDSVARVCIVPDFVLPARVNQHVAIIRVDKSKADNNYVLYSLIKSKKDLLNLAGGGATRNALTKKMIEEFEIELPSLSLQKRIADQLSEIDSQIECNRKICANLEAQAQALFKHWFIDFAPFKDGKFIDSELGMIPEGWRVGTLGEICSYSGRKVTISSLDKNNYYSTENMLPNKAGADEASTLPQTGMTTACMPYDVLVSNIRPYFKKIIRVMKPCGCSSDVLCFHPIDTIFRSYLYRVLYDDSFFNYVMAGSKGTKMPRGDKNQIMKYPIILPDSPGLKEFNNIVEPMFELIFSLKIESSRLSALRDTLLPKLMSGQIKL